MSICSWFKRTAGTPPGALVIIIGHGIGKDKGAWGVSPIDEYEYSFNTEQAGRMAAYAKSIGLHCTVLNKSGSSTAAVGAAATQIVKDFGGRGCVIELHFNSYNGKATGTETLYDTAEPDNARFAQICQNAMVGVFGRMDRKIKHDTGRGGSNLAAVKVTSCLVEPLFADNPVEARLLKEKREEYARALVDAAVTYLRGLA